MAYFKLLNLCKMALYPRSLKWTYKPEILRCPYISLTIVKSKLEHVHSVEHIRDSELFIWGKGLKILNIFIKKRATFGTDLCCGQHNVYVFLLTKHNLMQNFKAQIFIQSKTQHTIMQQNVPLQHQFYWAATDKWMQFSHDKNKK